MYKIIITHHFKKQLKKLTKRDPNLKEQLSTSLKSFTIPIGKHVYKHRIASNSKGKSGGYRVYIFLVEIENILAPLCIYAKNTKESISHEELTAHIEKIKAELSNLI